MENWTLFSNVPSDKATPPISSDDFWGTSAVYLRVFTVSLNSHMKTMNSNNMINDVPFFSA